MRAFQKFFRFWIFVALVVIAIYLAFYNRDHVNVSLPPFLQVVPVPSFLLMLGCFLLGVLAATVWFVVDSVAKSLLIRSLHKKISKLEKATSGAPQEPFFQRHRDF